MAKCVFNKGVYTAETLFQWDYNQEVEISGLPIDTATEVHFYHDWAEKAIVRPATMDQGGVIRAMVPNSLLQKPYRIHAVICVYEGTAFKSLWELILPVRARAKPDDYAAEPEDEEFSIEALGVKTTILLPGETPTVSKYVEDGTGFFLFGLPLPVGISSIQRTKGNGAPGTTDTYTVTLNNGHTDEILIYNGKDGPKGDIGATPKLTIGTVETLKPGEAATARLDGTPENPVLHFGIPGGITPDLSVSDPDDPAYVKNRTHGPVRISTTVPLNNDGVLVEGDKPYYLYKISDAVVVDGDCFIGAVVSAYNSFLKWTMDKVETVTVSYGNAVTQAFVGNTVYLVSTTAEAFNSHMGADLLTEDGTYLRWPVITDSTEVGAPVTVTTGELYAALPKKYLPPLPSLPVMVGKNVEGKEYTVDDLTIPAAWGAEVFNDYENNISTGPHSHAEGTGTTADGTAAHAEGQGTKAGRVSHAEGYRTQAVGIAAHSEGYETNAAGRFGAHAEGYQTKSRGEYGSHAEGHGTDASGDYGSHAEGVGTVSSAYGSHAEGGKTTASGEASHAEGKETTASGMMSHAEGHGAVASGTRSHAEGTNTIAAGDSQHVQGKRNVEDNEGKYAHIVGNGDSSERSNAHTLDWNGNAWFAGDVYVRGTGQDDKNAARLLRSNEVPDWARAKEKPSYTFAEIIEKPVFVGKRVTGTEYTVANAPMTAEDGAEVFNSDSNIAVGAFSHAEGSVNKALGFASHAEGNETEAYGECSHAEGKLTVASGANSHAEGQDTRASGHRTHAEGLGTRALGDCQHVQGKYNVEDPQHLYAHIVGNGTAEKRSNAHTLDWNGNAWFAGDISVGAGKKKLSAVGQDVAGQRFTLSYGDDIVTAGAGAEIFNDYRNNKATGEYSHAEGANTEAVGSRSHAEGLNTRALGDSSHAEGGNAVASGDYDHAEGLRSTASGGFGAHAEGADTTASGFASHAEGSGSKASGHYSHAEGTSKATGYIAHAEGGGTLASGSDSHSEGSMTEASGANSHAEGNCTIAAGKDQHVQGRYNVEDTENKYAHIVGNGTDANNRSNAHTVDWSGNAWYAGSLTLNGTFKLTAGADGFTLTDTETGESVKLGDADVDEAELTAALEEVLGVVDGDTTGAVDKDKLADALDKILS